MKKIFVLFFISRFFILPVFSQTGDNNGGDFLKRIEYNKLVFNRDNFKSKEEIEKRFFGDFNAPFEFCYEGSFARQGIYGFRVFMDSLKNTHILEIKSIVNLQALQQKVQDKYPVRTLSSSEMASMPRDSLNLISNQNTVNIQKATEEKSKLSDIDSRSFPVSAQFAEILYKKAVSLIANFKATGICPLIDDGYTVTFRTVVDDEVWSLRIHCPAGNAFKMSNLYKQIVTETLATGKVDESRYIQMLDDFN